MYHILYPTSVNHGNTINKKVDDGVEMIGNPIQTVASIIFAELQLGKVNHIESIMKYNTVVVLDNTSLTMKYYNTFERIMKK